MSEVTRRRVLLCATTTGYQIRMFDEAASRLGIELVLATDRCDHLADPWRDRAIAVRFYDEPSSVAAVLEALDGTHLDGVLAVGDRPVVLAALVAAARGLPWHPVEAARVSRDKRMFREHVRRAGLPAPWSITVPASPGPDLATGVSYPCVVKPLVLSGSRGVIRANDPGELAEALARVGRLLQAADVRALRDPAAGLIQIEGYVAGFEAALEGVMDRGRLQVLAVFDKPAPLEGPYFEETIYVTPTPRVDAHMLPIVAAVAQAARAAGLWHGPIHAECRVSGDDAVVLEIAARPIGGLCARALRHQLADGTEASLEELLLRHATGEPLEHWRREAQASGVMMVPIPRSGVLRQVRGAEVAARVGGITDVVVTAKIDQRLVALPEGASYLGFIFASGPSSAAVERALREAHAALVFDVEPFIEVLPSGP